MNPITVTEQFLLDKIREIFGRKLKTIASLPGNWDENMLQRLIMSSPACFVTFLGGPVISGDGPITGITSVWGVYAVSTDPAGSTVRNLGRANTLGAYDILGTLVPAVHNQTIPDIGTLQLSGSIDNLFKGSLAKQNLTIYEAQFSLRLYFEEAVDPATLDDFLTFHADYNINSDGSSDASDTQSVREEE
jgi:phage gp37-like protein